MGKRARKRVRALRDPRITEPLRIAWRGPRFTIFPTYAVTPFRLSDGRCGVYYLRTFDALPGVRIVYSANEQGSVSHAIAVPVETNERS